MEIILKSRITFGVHLVVMVNNSPLECENCFLQLFHVHARCLSYLRLKDKWMLPICLYGIARRKNLRAHFTYYRTQALPRWIQIGIGRAPWYA